VESTLGVTMVAHESYYRCGDYYLYTGPSEEHFILQKNFHSFDKEWTEPDSKDKPFLLYLTATSRFRPPSAAGRHRSFRSRDGSSHA